MQSWIFCGSCLYVFLPVRGYLRAIRAQNKGGSFLILPRAATASWKKESINDEGGRLVSSAESDCVLKEQLGADTKPKKVFANGSVMELEGVVGLQNRTSVGDLRSAQG